jgi:hypothetical protein
MHTSSQYFIYALPRPASLVFHVFPVQELIDLYNAKTDVWREGVGTYYKYPHKIVGDQPTNEAVASANGDYGNGRAELVAFIKSIKYQQEAA